MPQSDVTVTILSRNRAHFIGETIQSFLAQTLLPAKIVVLDNASDSATVRVIEGYRGKNVVLDRVDRAISVKENFLRARVHADTGWVMVAHDDDIYHPEYLARVSKELSTAPDVGVIVAGMAYGHAPSLNFGWSLSDSAMLKLDRRALAGLMFNGYPINFGASIYSRDAFTATEPDWDTFANLFDRPYLLSCAGRGGVLLLKGKAVKYRIHPGQDVKNAAKRLPARYAVNLVREYHGILGSGTALRPGAYSRRAMYCLRTALAHEKSDFLPAVRYISSLNLLQGGDWLWGLLCYPWYFLRYRAAEAFYALRGKVSLCGR